MKPYQLEDEKAVRDHFETAWNQIQVEVKGEKTQHSVEKLIGDGMLSGLKDGAVVRLISQDRFRTIIIGTTYWPIAVYEEMQENLRSARYYVVSSMRFNAFFKEHFEDIEGRPLTFGNIKALLGTTDVYTENVGQVIPYIGALKQL